MSCLLLDAGNTRLKWALLDGPHWLAQGVCAYAELAELPAQLAPWPAVQRILACNVAGPTVAEQLAACWPALSISWLKSSAAQAGVRNGYLRPEQLGADRWAALIGARALRQTDLLVVMAGTAMTVDALSSTGEFLGGVIVPGFRLMREALARGTADLGLPDGATATFARSTGEAIVNGALAALSGAIDQQYAQLSAHSGGTVQILLSGGDAARIAPCLPPALAAQLIRIDNLVLHGLAQLAQRDSNQEASA